MTSMSVRIGQAYQYRGFRNVLRETVAMVIIETHPHLTSP
jgi:hypothetical protein